MTDKNLNMIFVSCHLFVFVFPPDQSEVCNAQSRHSQETFTSDVKKEQRKHGFTPHGFKFPGKGLCIILNASEKVLHKILVSSSDLKSVVEMAFPFVSKVFFGRGQDPEQVSQNSSTEQNDIKQRLKPLSGSH